MTDPQAEELSATSSTPTTIPAVLRSRVAQMPDAAAIVAHYGGEYRAISFADLDAKTTAFARVLVGDHAVAPGDRVAWALGNDRGAAALIVYHAVLKAGGVNVPVNTRLHPREVADVLERSGSTVLVYDDRLEALARQDVVPLENLIAVPDETAMFPSVSSSTAALPDVRPDDLASILYTSGTTGRSKGVAHTHATSLASGAAWGGCFSLTSADVLQSPFPVFSGGCLHFDGLACLLAGTTFLVDEATDTEASLDRVEKWGSTVYAAVPSIYQYWLDSGLLEGRRLRALRLLDFGGAAMPVRTIAGLQAALPGIALIQTYGLTEAGPGGTFLAPEHALTRTGSIGAGGAGEMEIRVIREDGTDVEPGEAGELVLRGPSVMQGYYRDPEATSSVFINGWLRSGDLVRSDEDGFLYFVDRKKDIIVRGGYNISSFEIEEVLLADPAVKDAAVFGIPHPALGEVVAAAVVFRNPATGDVDEVRRRCAGHLADFKVPRDIIALDSLPRNAGGKILKWRLAEQLVATKAAS